MTPLSRRTLLRGAAGIGIALPWLEAMAGNRAFAQVASPLRYLLGYAGVSLGGYDGDINQTFVPTTVGANYDLKAALLNLAPIKSQVSVISGLRIPTAAENNGTVPSAGRPVAFHGNQVAPLLTGTRTQSGSFSTPTSEHLAAALIGGNTPFRPLVVRVQVSAYVNSAAPGTGDNISYRANGTGVTAVPPRYSPQQLFSALFGNFSGAGLTADQVAHQRWLQETRRSVLDSVAARGSLREKLGAGDRLRLDAHLQEVRELESRVAAVAPPTVGLCQKPMDPGPDPQVGSGQLTDSTTGNITYTQNLGYSGEDARAQVITELVAMAMICDLTRSTLLQFTNSQSFMNMFQITGQKSDLHELSHGSHGNQTEGNTTQALAKGINWHMKHWASLLGRLQAAQEGERTVLDNTAAVFSFKNRHGFDPADSRAISAHSTENMGMLVAGGAGGLKRGVHLKATGKHPAQVLLTALRAIGSTQTSFGEVSGEIPGLRA